MGKVEASPVAEAVTVVGCKIVRVLIEIPIGSTIAEGLVPILELSTDEVMSLGKGRLPYIVRVVTDPRMVRTFVTGLGVAVHVTVLSCVECT